MSESQEDLYDLNDPQEANYAENIAAQESPGEDETEPEAPQDESTNEPEDTPEAPENGTVDVITTDDIKRRARDRKWKQVDSTEASDED